MSNELGSLPAVGNDAAGNVIVAFIGAGGRAQHAVFDGAGPIVDGVSIPGQGALGEQQQFSVRSARDAWSPMGSLTWLFSDGLSATGASVAHAFGESGTNSARLRATDALGNRTTVTGTVEVPAAPAAPAAPADTALRHRLAAPRDATAPVFTTKPKVRSGALRFALSEPATVVAVITRKATGVRRGKRCVAPPRRKTKARKCTRQVAVATVRAKLKPGAGKLALPKKARRTKGTYTIALTVTRRGRQRDADADDLPGLLGLAMNVTHSLHLELRFDGAAPVGHVCLAGGEPHAFSGWVGLVSAVDDLVPRDREPQPVGDAT